MKKDANKPRLSDREKAEALVYPVVLEPAEQYAATRDLNAVLEARRAQMSKDTQLELALYQLKSRLETYVKENQIAANGFRLAIHSYAATIDRSQDELAIELQLAPEKFNSLLDTDNMNIDLQALLFRLEIHSRNILPASLWYDIIRRLPARKALKKEFVTAT